MNQLQSQQPSATQLKNQSHHHIYIHEWLPDVSPTCAIVIAHGMGEHGGRYDELAHRLTDEGYVVYAPDHRGHGRTAGTKDKFGHLADRNGWNLVIEDLRAIIEDVRYVHPQLPIILFGHSMGSLLTRRYIQLYGDQIQGVILSGTSGDPGFMGNIGKLIAQWAIHKSGPSQHNPFLKKLLFGGFNKKFGPYLTPFEWLSRDPKEIDRYLNDEWVGTNYSSAFFYDLINGVMELNKPQELSRTPRHLPILIFSGEQDPVGNFTRGVLQTYYRFSRIGITDVTLKLYEDARHETIHDLNREEVFADIIHWIRAKIAVAT